MHNTPQDSMQVRISFPISVAAFSNQLWLLVQDHRRLKYPSQSGVCSEHRFKSPEPRQDKTLVIVALACCCPATKYRLQRLNKVQFSLQVTGYVP